MEKRVFVAAGIVLAIGVLLICILVPMSFSGVEYYEFGFVRQRSTGKVDTKKVYKGGKYHIGPDYEFKTFSSTAHFVDFYASVFTYNKLEISIRVYFQYFLRQKDLPILHQKYDINYNHVVEKSALAALKGETPNFETEQFITDRARVEAALFKAIRERLGGNCCQDDCTTWEFACPKNCIPEDRCDPEKDKGLWVDVKSFQLGRVAIPKKVEERYLRSLMLIEENEIEKRKQESQVIRKATEKNVMDIENEAEEIRQRAQSESNKIETLSRANYTVMVEKARSEGLKSLYNRLNIKDEAIMTSFDYLRTLRGLNNVHLTVDFQQRIVGALGGN